MERTVVVTEVTDIAVEAEAVLMTVLLGMMVALMVVMEGVRSAREVMALERTLVPTHSARGASCRGRAGSIAWTAVATITTEAVVEESCWTVMGQGIRRTRVRDSEVAAGLFIIGATRESFCWRWNLGSQMLMVQVGPPDKIFIRKVKINIQFSVQDVTLSEVVFNILWCIGSNKLKTVSSFHFYVGYSFFLPFSE